MFEIDFIKTSIIFVNVEQDIQLFSSQMFDVDKLKLYLDLVKDIIIASGLYLRTEAADDTLCVI
jgi:hypothetical protein